MLAEWLRRLTRNQLGFARVGSNPAHDVRFFLLMCSVGSTHISVERVSWRGKKRGAFLAVLLLYKKKERRRANEIF